jgi:lipopolysaccharide heptosyltransferase II
LIYLIYRAASEAVALLPLKVVFLLGRLLGSIAYMIIPKYRRLVLANLTIAFGGEKTPAELRSIARSHFSTLGANLLSSYKLATLTREEIDACVEIEGMENLHRAAAPGKGAIPVVAHLGNWEVLAQLGPHYPRGKGFGTIYQPLGNPYIDQHVKQTRARLGLTAFDRRKGFAEPIRFLRNGGVSAILVDQHAGDHGIWTPFFGRLASTSPLAATISLRTGAPLVPMAVYTAGWARWRLVVSEPIRSSTHDPDVLTAEINLALEKEIRSAPADWFWVHNRWKTPKPEFLLANYRRGVTLPPGMQFSELKPFRILVRSTNWLGDAVMSVPAVRAIKSGRPDAHITILTAAKLVDFWKTVPEVDEIVAIERGEGVFTVARKIRGRFDVAFVFPNSVRTGLEVWLAGIPRRVGFRRPWRGRMINQIVPDAKPAPMTHEVKHYLAMAKYAGADIKAAMRAQPALPALNRDAKPKLGLVPGAEYGPAKRWLPESFAAVAKSVRESTGAEWRILGVEGDRPVADVIAAALEGQCENLAGKTTLAELIEHLRGCRLVLSNDTGAMHLAAHLGVPVIAVFGSTEQRLTGPMGPRSRVIRHQTVCSPCFLRECPLDLRCMKAVTVEEVTAAVLGELGKVPAL